MGFKKVMGKFSSIVSSNRRQSFLTPLSSKVKVPRGKIEAGAGEGCMFKNFPLGLNLKPYKFHNCVV